MKRITRESVAAKAAERWREQYFRNGEWASVSLRNRNGTQSAQVIYDKLVALGPNPSGHAVNDVVGNDCWGSPPSCDECESRDHDVVLQVGQEPDYESATVYLCMNCVFKASMLIGNEEAVTA